MPTLTPRLKGALVAALLSVLAAYGIVVQTDPNTGLTTITINVQGTTGPTTVTTTSDAIDKAESSELGDHAGARDETPTGVTGGQVGSARAQQSRLAQRDKLPLTQPDAAPVQKGCRSNFVRSYSSRGGVKPRLWVNHYTVSPNLPGFRDINSLTAYSNNSNNMVSWHFNIDREGNCAYTVREADKAWTQALLNRVSIAAEIINTGRERPLFSARGLRRYARIVSDSTRRWGIPVRRGAINLRTCTVTRPGIVDHNDLGACGGSHHDITPFDVDDLIAAVKRHRRQTSLTARRCDELKRIRAKGRRGAWTGEDRDRARALKAVLGDRAAGCR